MRKIYAQTEKQKKDARNKMIIGIILVIVMIFGTMGYAFLSNTEEEIPTITHNGVEFTLNEYGLWSFQIQGFGFSTAFNPEQTTDIYVSIFTTLNDFYDKPLFFIGQTPARQELERNLWNFISRTQDVCLEDTDSKECENLPIKNCSEDNIIILKESTTNTTQITKKENCITISAPLEEQTKAADAFLFKILGINNIF